MLDDPATVAASVTTLVIGVAAGIRYAIKAFFKDRVDINVSHAANDVINTLRDEVGRLAISVSELSRVNVEVRDERDRLRTEVTQLTYAVNSIKDVLITILGEEEAMRRLHERGIERRPSGSGSGFTDSRSPGPDDHDDDH